MEKEIKFDGCRLELRLIAQSPQIHFQSDEHGATLRGSELKPKLDNFLCSKMEMKDKKSLDYKVQITCAGKQENVEIGILQNKRESREEAYSIFYGNTGQKKSGNREIKGVWSDPMLTIICFDNDLQKIIEENITEFFFTTNFGMMQNKGFGSYIPAGMEGVTPETMKTWMTRTHKTNLCWRISINDKISDELDKKNKRCIEQFRMIKSFYGILKSGKNFGGYERSFLFEYMHKNESKIEDSSNVIKSIDNEKAWMKQNGIAPIYSKDNKNNDRHDRKDENSRYVRAFLGLSGTQVWQYEHGRMNISVSDPEGKIERISSPVYFKIIGNDIYFVITAVPEEIYDYKFKFQGSKSGNLETPAKEQFKNKVFDTQALMTAYVDYFNVKVNDKTKKSFSKVEEVK